MPYDPRVFREDEGIRGDDAGFESAAELQFPDDLTLLAEQLGDDAARLAATYPSPTPRVLAVSRREPAVEPSSRRTTWLTRSLAGTALAVGLLAISLVALNYYSGLTGQPDEASPSARRNLAGTVPSPATPQPPIPVTHASFLGETSGPELEALMDLWEQDQPAVRSLSF